MEGHCRSIVQFSRTSRGSRWVHDALLLLFSQLSRYLLAYLDLVRSQARQYPLAHNTLGSHPEQTGFCGTQLVRDGDR